MTLFRSRVVTHVEQRPQPQQPPHAHSCFDILTSGSLEGAFVGKDAVVRRLASDS